MQRNVRGALAFRAGAPRPGGVRDTRVPRTAEPRRHHRRPPPAPAPWPALDPERYRTVREQWGIEPVFLRLSAHDQMLDFRYRVTDAEKAAPLMLRTVDRTLIDLATGRKLVVPAPPKVGRLRQTTLRPEEGRVYFMLFGNPGGAIRRGAKMTVVIGDCRIEDLVVR